MDRKRVTKRLIFILFVVFALNISTYQISKGNSGFAINKGIVIGATDSQMSMNSTDSGNKKAENTMDNSTDKKSNASMTNSNETMEKSNDTMDNSKNRTSTSDKDMKNMSNSDMKKMKDSDSDKKDMNNDSMKETDGHNNENTSGPNLVFLGILGSIIILSIISAAVIKAKRGGVINGTNN